MRDLDLHLLTHKWLMSFKVSQKVLRISLLKNPDFPLKVQIFYLPDHFLLMFMTNFHAKWLCSSLSLSCGYSDQPEEGSTSSSSVTWGHLQFYIYMVTDGCLCFGSVLSLSQKVSSSPTGVTASLSNMMTKCLSEFLWEWSLNLEKQNQFRLSCIVPDHESIVMRSPIRVRKQIIRVIHSIWLRQS